MFSSVVRASHFPTPQLRLAINKVSRVTLKMNLIQKIGLTTEIEGTLSLRIDHVDLGYSLVHHDAGSTVIRLLAMPEDDRAFSHRPKGQIHSVFYSNLPNREELPDCLQSLWTSAEGRRQSSGPVGDLGKNRKIARSANCERSGVKHLALRRHIKPPIRKRNFGFRSDDRPSGNNYLGNT